MPPHFLLTCYSRAKSETCSHLYTEERYGLAYVMWTYHVGYAEQNVGNNSLCIARLSKLDARSSWSASFSSQFVIATRAVSDVTYVIILTSFTQSSKGWRSNYPEIKKKKKGWWRWKKYVSNFGWKLALKDSTWFNLHLSKRCNKIHLHSFLYMHFRSIPISGTNLRA